MCLFCKMSSAIHSRIFVASSDMKCAAMQLQVSNVPRNKFILDKELFSSSNLIARHLDISDPLTYYMAIENQGIASVCPNAQKLFSKKASNNCHEDYSEIDFKICYTPKAARPSTYNPADGLRSRILRNINCLKSHSSHVRSFSEITSPGKKHYENYKIRKTMESWNMNSVLRRHSCPSFGLKHSPFRATKTLKKGDIVVECGSVADLILKEISSEQVKPGRLTLFCDKGGDLILGKRINFDEFKGENNDMCLYPQKMTTHQATVMLNLTDEIGCFLLYHYQEDQDTDCNKCMLSLTIAPKEVLHYKIKRFVSGDFFIEGDTKSFPTLLELVKYFSSNRRHLARRLRMDIQKSLKSSRFLKLTASQYNIKRDQVITTKNLLSCDGESEYYFGVVEDGSGSQNKIRLKLLIDESSEALDDFIYGASLLKSLNHANVISLVGIDLNERPYCLMTEYPPYGPLRSCLSDGIISSSSQRTLNSLCLQILKSLQYLEGKRFIIHRKLSASCFYVTERHVIKLGDFDRARKTNDNQFVAEGDEHVLVKYAAPEVLTRLLYSTKSDVWALGVTFWEIFQKGTVPYPFVKASDLIIGVVSGQPPLPLDECTSFIRDIILKCLNKDPSRRPTASQLLRIFEQQIVQDTLIGEKPKEPRNIRNRTQSFSSFSTFRQGKDMLHKFLGKNIFIGSSSTFCTPTTARKTPATLQGPKFRQLTTSSKEALLRGGSDASDSVPKSNNQKKDLKPPSGKKI